MSSSTRTTSRNNRNRRVSTIRVGNNSPRMNSNRPLVSGRTSSTSKKNKTGKINTNAVSYLRGTERVTTLTIPTTSKAGDLLYVLEGNPNSAPRARAVASQFDSWSSSLEMEVETTGNAFSKNFILLRHIPNGDVARLAAPGQSLLNTAEAYDREYESVKLQLDSNAKGVCKAPWSALTYNPRKPINDTDPSERNLGLFIIVSNGSPGAEPVDITVRFRYDFRFYGPIFQPLLPNSSLLLTNVTTSTSAPFTNATIVGPGNAVFTGSAIRFPTAGSYLLNIQATTYSAFTIAYSGIVATNISNVSQDTVATNYSAIIAVTANSTATVTITGSITLIKVVLAPFLTNPIAPTIATVTSTNSVAPSISSSPSTLETLANFANQMNLIQSTVTALETIVGKIRRPRENDNFPTRSALPTSDSPDPNRIG